jgi:hypothetical protein
MSSTVDPLKLLNRGPAYLRSAFQTQTQNNKNSNQPSLSAAERLNVRKKTFENKDDDNGEDGAETENIENAKKKQKNRPTTAPPTTQSSKQEHAKRSEFETWTAEQLVNRGSEAKQEKGGGYAARMLANTRPKSAMPYSLASQPTTSTSSSSRKSQFTPATRKIEFGR